MTRDRQYIYALFVLALGLNIAMWALSNKMRPIWPNVPPVPGQETASSAGLGDTELAFRTLAFQLQQMGNEGGVSTPLYRYDYNRLGDWFHLLHDLNNQSRYVPYVAAYYFAATQDPKRQLGPVVDYLSDVGREPEAGKWRWLAQAVYITKYKLEDHDRALRLAYDLAALPGPMPHWAKQMPAILSAEMGDRDTALRLMKSILVDMLNPVPGTARPDPNEINFVVDFICNRLLTPIETRTDPVCSALAQ